MELLLEILLNLFVAGGVAYLVAKQTWTELKSALT